MKDVVVCCVDLALIDAKHLLTLVLGSQIILP
jgi:hypothetical protein